MNNLERASSILPEEKDPSPSSDKSAHERGPLRGSDLKQSGEAKVTSPEEVKGSKSVPIPGEKPKTTLENKLFRGKEDYSPEHLKNLREDLEDMRDEGRWLSLARRLSHMQQAGVRIKEKSRDKWFSVLNEQIDTFRQEAKETNNPRKFALYLSHLRYTGALAEGAVTADDKKLLTDYYNKEVNGSRTDRNFLRFCASLKYLGIKEKYQDDEGRLSVIAQETALSALNTDVEDDERGEKGKAMMEDVVRLKYVGLSVNGFLSQEEVSTRLTKTLDQARSNKWWKPFAELAVMYKYLKPDSSQVSDEDKKGLRQYLEIFQNASKEKEQIGSRERFIRLAADLVRLERKKYDMDTVVIDGIKSSDNESIDRTNESSVLDDPETDASDAPTAVISEADTVISSENKKEANALSDVRSIKLMLQRVQAAKKSIYERMRKNEYSSKEKKGRLQEKDIFRHRLLMAEEALLKSGDEEKIKRMVELREKGFSYMGLEFGDGFRITDGTTMIFTGMSKFQDGRRVNLQFKQIDTDGSEGNEYIDGKQLLDIQENVVSIVKQMETDPQAAEEDIHPLNSK